MKSVGSILGEVRRTQTGYVLAWLQFSARIRSQKVGEKYIGKTVRMWGTKSYGKDGTPSRIEKVFRVSVCSVRSTLPAWKPSRKPWRGPPAHEAIRAIRDEWD